jgi:antitoxin ParD1/3/4
MNSKQPVETMNIALPESMKEFVHEQAAAGGYSSVSEYVRELIRSAQRQKGEEQLDRLLLDGINSGPAEPMTKEDWHSIRREVRRRHTASKKTK